MDVADDDFFTNVAVLLTGFLVTGFGFTLPAFGLSTTGFAGGTSSAGDFLTIFGGLASITAFSEASLI